MYHQVCTKGIDVISNKPTYTVTVILWNLIWLSIIKELFSKKDRWYHSYITTFGEMMDIFLSNQKAYYFLKKNNYVHVLCVKAMKMCSFC